MLATDQLVFSYPNGDEALHGISLDFANGQVIGLIGANGSGKSTLFMNLLGLLKPQQGRVLLDGQPLDYSRAALRALRQRVAMVFQDPEQQIFYTDIYSDIAFGLRNLGVDEAIIAQRIELALTLVDAQHFRHKPVQYLSGGQKKRVAIAGALVLDAECLLLDEPTAGLDPDGREKMIAIIQRIVNAGKRVVISSHDIDLIYQICDYLYVLKQGRLLVEGNERSVFMQQEVIHDAGLSQPWLVKLHTRLGMPLYKTEQELFAAESTT